MLRSKLNATKYPTADPKVWLVFLSGVDSNIDPVFAGRLAAFAHDHGKKLTINSGYRSIEKQIELYNKDGGRQDAAGNWYGGTGYVAKPGRSFHNFRLAIDTTSMWAKFINRVEPTSMQKELLKYGLFKPMTKGNGQTVLEDWHIQPIETLNVPLEKRKELMPVEEFTRIGIVNGNKVNVRNKPSKDGVAEEKQLMRGTKVDIFDTVDGWYRIGPNRWVYSQYVTIE